MLILIALPILFTVATFHRYLHLYAPSNLLLRSVLTHEPQWRNVAILVAIIMALLVAIHLVTDAVASGAPGWLNLVVLVLAWDAIKVGLAGVAMAWRSAVQRIRPVILRGR